MLPPPPEDRPPPIGPRAENDSLIRREAAGGEGRPPLPPLPPPLGPGVNPAGDQVGTVIAGKYVLDGEIGRGAAGVVMKARETGHLKRTIALKLTLTREHTPEAVARFLLEGQNQATMNHPNIASVYETGSTADGRLYLSMEWVVGGVPITEYCDARRLGVNERLRLFGLVCDAVHHAHLKGVIHRDIKPKNVLVADVDGKAVPKVIDFGVSTTVDPAGTEWSPVGTLQYMPPEQTYPCPDGVDARADIYSLGAVLFELLAGDTPLALPSVDRADPDEALRAVRETPVPSPSDRLRASARLGEIAASRGVRPKRLVGSVRGDLDWVTARCLKKDREARYQSAEKLATDVQDHLCWRPVWAAPSSFRYVVRKFVRRNWELVSAASLVFTFLIVGAAAAVRGSVREAALAKETLQAVLGLLNAQGNADAYVAEYESAVRQGLSVTPEMRLGYLRALAGREPTDRILSELQKVPLDGLPADSRPRFHLWWATALYGTDDAAAEGHLAAALAGPLPEAEREHAEGLRDPSPAGAVEHFRNAVTHDWLYQPARSNACFLLLVLGRLDEAAALAAESARLLPQHPDFPVVALVANALRGDEAAAAAAARRLRQFPPGTVSASHLDLFESLPEALRLSVRAYRAKFGYAPPLALHEVKTLVVLQVKLAAGGFAGKDAAAVTALAGRVPRAHRHRILLYQDALTDVLLGDGAAARTLIGRLNGDAEGFVYLTAANAFFVQGTLGGIAPGDPPEKAAALRAAAAAAEVAAAAPGLLPVRDMALDLAALARGYLGNEAVRGALAEPGEVAQAAALVRRRLRLHGDVPLSILRPITGIALRAGDRTLARELVDRWERQQPGDLTAAYFRAKIEYASEAYGPAVQAAERVVAAPGGDDRLKGQQQEARQILADARQKLGLPELAPPPRPAQRGE